MIKPCSFGRYVLVFWWEILSPCSEKILDLAAERRLAHVINCYSAEKKRTIHKPKSEEPVVVTKYLMRMIRRVQLKT